MSIRRKYRPLAVSALALAAVAAATGSWWFTFGPPVFGADHRPDSFLVNKIAPSDIRYVAVGDSYTCGTGTTPDRAWPALLASDLRAHGVPVGLAANLGMDGWTTQMALDQEIPVFRKQAPVFATLMIGVNDTYRPTTAAQFRAQLRSLIARMQSVLPDKKQILLVTIPDYTVTRGGTAFAAPGKGSSRIVAFNAIIKEEAGKHGLPLVDVFPLSQKMADAPDLTAADNLHPSAKEYALWEKTIFPVALRILQPSASAPMALRR